jgi:DNA-binding NarL/FixJ family response regulator
VAIVALSADEGDSIVRAMLRAGAVTFMHKSSSGVEALGALAETIQTGATRAT